MDINIWCKMQSLSKNTPTVAGGQRGCRNGRRDCLGNSNGGATKIKHNIQQQFSGRDVCWAMSTFTWAGRKDSSSSIISQWGDLAKVSCKSNVMQGVICVSHYFFSVILFIVEHHLRQHSHHCMVSVSPHRTKSCSFLTGTCCRQERCLFPGCTLCLTTAICSGQYGPPAPPIPWRK